MCAFSFVRLGLAVLLGTSACALASPTKKEHACLLSILQSTERDALAKAQDRCSVKTSSTRIAFALRLAELEPGLASDDELISAIPKRTAEVASLYALTLVDPPPAAAGRRVGELPYEFLDRAAQAAARRGRGYDAYVRLFFLTEPVSEEFYYRTGGNLRLLLRADKVQFMKAMRALKPPQQDVLCGGPADPDCLRFLQEEEETP